MRMTLCNRPASHGRGSAHAWNRFLMVSMLSSVRPSLRPSSRASITDSGQSKYSTNVGSWRRQRTRLFAGVPRECMQLFAQSTKPRDGYHRQCCSSTRSKLTPLGLRDRISPALQVLNVTKEASRHCRLFTEQAVEDDPALRCSPRLCRPRRLRGFLRSAGSRR